MFDFSHIPILETERFRLRPMTDADAAALYEHFNDPEVLRYIIFPWSKDSPEAMSSFIDWQKDMFDKREGMRWAITLRGGNDRLIGTCGWHYWDPQSRRCEIGYDLQPAYWGQGVMTEVMRVVVQWCFDQLDVHRIQSDCTAGNIGSERVMEKLGFTLEGVWREHDFENGRFVDIKQYGLLRREFMAQTGEPEAPFRVVQIDHVEVFVPDRYAAAQWYAQVFGMRILPQHEDWASDPNGPLMISSNFGGTMIALFAGRPPNQGGPFSAKRVAFRVDGQSFLRFLDRLSTIHIENDGGDRLTRDQFVDHGKAWSIYFRDPYGNRYEITTYAYGFVKQGVGK